jgi:hypothetical protein
VRVAVASDVAVGGAAVALAGGACVALGGGPCVALGGGALVTVARGASSSPSSWPAHAARRSSMLSEVAVTAQGMRDACLIILSFDSSRSRAADSTQTSLVNDSATPTNNEMRSRSSCTHLDRRDQTKSAAASVTCPSPVLPAILRSPPSRMIAPHWRV